MFSVPSILRNNRYRRDQRQLEEEEEMWFNEEDDFDDGEAVVPANTSNIINKKLSSELDSIGEHFSLLMIELFRLLDRNGTRIENWLDSKISGSGIIVVI